MAEKTEEQKETKPTLGYDVNKLELSQVALEYLQQGETTYAQKAVEMTLKDIGRYESYVTNILSKPQNLQDTIQGQLETYAQFSKDITVLDVAKKHGKTLDSLLGENKGKFQENLKDFESKKYGDIILENKKADFVIEGFEKYKLGSEEDYKKAKKTKDKNDRVFALSLAERKHQDGLKQRVENEVFKELIEQKYAKFKEEDSKEENKK